MLPFRQLASGFKISHVHFVAFASLGVNLSQHFGLAFCSPNIWSVSDFRKKKLKIKTQFLLSLKCFLVAIPYAKKTQKLPPHCHQGISFWDTECCQLTQWFLVCSNFYFLLMPRGGFLFQVDCLGGRWAVRRGRQGLRGMAHSSACLKIQKFHCISRY